MLKKKVISKCKFNLSLFFVNSGPTVISYGQNKYIFTKSVSYRTHLKEHKKPKKKPKAVKDRGGRSREGMTAVKDPMIFYPLSHLFY